MYLSTKDHSKAAYLQFKTIVSRAYWFHPYFTIYMHNSNKNESRLATKKKYLLITFKLLYGLSKRILTGDISCGGNDVIDTDCFNEETAIGGGGGDDASFAGTAVRFRILCFGGGGAIVGGIINCCCSSSSTPISVASWCCGGGRMILSKMY